MQAGEVDLPDSDEMRNDGFDDECHYRRSEIASNLRTQEDKDQKLSPGEGEACQQNGILQHKEQEEDDSQENGQSRGRTRLEIEMKEK